MKKCKFCGTDIDDSVRFCPSCGAKTDDVQQAGSADKSADSEPVHEIPNDSGMGGYSYIPMFMKRPMNVPMLVWSIVNTAISALACCSVMPLASFVLGVIAIVFTVQARDAKLDEQEQSKLRTVKILNITASSIVVVSVIIWIALCILGIIGGMYANPFEYRFMY